MNSSLAVNAIDLIDSEDDDLEFDDKARSTRFDVFCPQYILMASLETFAEVEAPPH